MLAEQPLVETNHATHLAFQQQPEMLVDLQPCLRRSLAVAGMGNVPQPFQHVEDVENSDGTRKPTLFQRPQRALPVHPAKLAQQFFNLPTTPSCPKSWDNQQPTPTLSRRASVSTHLPNRGKVAWMG